MSMHRTPVMALVLALAACNGNAPQDRAGAPESPESAQERRTEAGTMRKIDAGLEAYAAEAESDLARRLEIDATEIELVEAQFVTWPDGALGCPEPGMMYTQALVPGYRVRLVANGNSHHYHGARDKPPFHCPAERVSPAADSEASSDVR